MGVSAPPPGGRFPLAKTICRHARPLPWVTPCPAATCWKRHNSAHGFPRTLFGCISAPSAAARPQPFLRLLPLSPPPNPTPPHSPTPNPNPTPAPQLFIGGQWVDAESGKTFPVLDPRTGEEVFRVAEADKADVDK